MQNGKHFPENLFLYVYVCVPECMYVQEPLKVRRSIGTGTQVIDCCEVLCRCWKPNPGRLLQEQLLSHLSSSWKTCFTLSRETDLPPA